MKAIDGQLFVYDNLSFHITTLSSIPGIPKSKSKDFSMLTRLINSDGGYGKRTVGRGLVLPLASHTTHIYLCFAYTDGAARIYS